MARLFNGLIVLFSVLLGTIVGAISYFGRSDYESLSASLYGPEAELLKSTFLEIVLTPIFAVSLLFIMALFIGKEWIVTSVKKRIAINVVGLVAIAALLGGMVYTIYAPIWSRAISSAAPAVSAA